jgi:nucleoside-diphosphate-sugar epimerase
MSPSRSTWRSIRSIILHALLRRFITNTIQCKRRRRACIVRSTCWDLRNAWRQEFSRLPRQKSMAIRTSTLRLRTIGVTSTRSARAEGKRCAETLFFDYWRQYRFEIKVARIFNTYGPRMHPNDGRVVSNFIVQALLGRDITVYGDGSQTRSFCYVDDLIDGLIRLMATSAEVTGPVNLGNSVEFSVLELARMVIDLTASHSRIIHRPRPEDDPKQRRPDISRAEDLLNWKPRTMVKDGLVNTIAYFDRLLSDQKLRAQLVM